MSGENKNVTVLGSGTMGAGIAEVCARAGFTTTLFDIDQSLADAGRARVEASLEKAQSKGKISEEDAKATLNRIVAKTSYDAHAQGWIIEAVPENLELKQKIFSELSKKAPSTVLASNTSSLSLTKIASACEAPERVIGLHFFNPAPIMALVEIVRANQTSDETLTRALEFVRALKKEPIVVKDIPGFATSRLGIILGMEAIRMLEDGVASAADIDKAMELGYRHPMGPLKLTDLVGLDVRLAIAKHLSKEIGPQFTPPALLEKMVQEKKLGKKSGEGFYLWSNNEAKPKP